MATAVPRIKGLDTLRGFAVLLVLTNHHPLFFRDGLKVPDCLKWIQMVGWTGVDLFFILSGFLIAGLLFKEIRSEGRLQILRFWFRRGMKIWPCYFLVFGLWTAWNLVYYHHRDDASFQRHLETIVPNSFFYQNYIMSTSWFAAWTLAIEEHFYLLLPVVLLGVLWLARKLSVAQPTGHHLCLTGGLIVLAAVPLLRWISLAGPTEIFSIYTPTHLRFDSLLAGVMLRYIHDFMPRLFQPIASCCRWLWPILLALGFVFASQCPISTHLSYYILGFTLIYVIYGTMVAAAAQSPDFGSSLPVAGPVLRLVNWCGVYSYTIYLVHGLFHVFPDRQSLGKFVFERIGAKNSWLALGVDFVLFYALALGAGWLLSQCVEQPILRWRERVWPSRSKKEKTHQDEAMPLAA